MEAVLKRLIGRLGSAAQGQSKPLDSQIKTLQAALRRQPPIDELETIISALTDAIAKLDSVPAPGASTTAAEPVLATLPVTAAAPSPTVDASLRSTLSILLGKLRSDPSLTILADE